MLHVVGGFVKEFAGRQTIRLVPHHIIRQAFFYFLPNGRILGNVCRHKAGNVFGFIVCAVGIYPLYGMQSTVFSIVPSRPLHQGQVAQPNHGRIHRVVAVVATFVKLQLGALLAAKGRKAFLFVLGRQRRRGQRSAKFSKIFLQGRGLVVRHGMGGIKRLPFGGVYFVVVFIIQRLMFRYPHQRQNAVKM